MTDNAQDQGDPKLDEEQVDLPVEEQPEDDDARLDAEYEAYMNGDGPAPIDTDTDTDTPPADAPDETATDAGSDTPDAPDDAGATPPDAEAADDDPFGEIRKEGAELRRQREQQAADKQEATPEAKPPQNEPQAPSEPPEKKESPRGLEAAMAQIDFDALPKVVMIGDQPHNLKALFDQATENYGEDDPILPLVTYALAQVSQKPQQAPSDQYVSNDQFQQFTQQANQALQQQQQVVQQLGWKAFMSDVAAEGAAEIIEINKDPEHPFLQHLKADADVAARFDDALNRGDAQTTAKVIQAWKAHQEKQKVEKIDMQRAEGKQRQDRLYAPTGGDKGKRGTQATGPMSEAEEDAIFNNLMKTIEV